MFEAGDGEEFVMGGGVEEGDVGGIEGGKDLVFVLKLKGRGWFRDYGLVVGRGG